MKLSVVIPTLDEAARIGELSVTRGVDEVLVVDGGSRDETFAIASARPGVRVLRAPRGRASDPRRAA